MCLANQLITRPRVIFLDEPITGRVKTGYDIGYKLALELTKDEIYLEQHCYKSVSFIAEIFTFLGLNSASSIEMLNILKHLCNNEHLVIMTMQTLPGKTALMFNQLVLVADEQVSKDPNPLPHGIFRYNVITMKYLVYPTMTVL